LLFSALFFSIKLRIWCVMVYSISSFSCLMNSCPLLDYLLFSDTETTGLIDPVRLVQLGCVSSDTRETLNELVLPPKEIELGARAVCPIRWVDVMYK
jgi:hypothetical protein